MNDDLHFPIEERLRREAQELSSRYPRSGSPERLQAEHRRRRRRRVRQTAAVGCLAAMAIALAWTWTRPTFDAIAPLRLAETPPPAPPVVPAEAPPAVLAEKQPEIELDEQPSAAPMAFLVTDEGGRRVVAVGVYIPPRIEKVNLRDLPPLEQAAVRRVLDLEEEEFKPTI
jgi:hypothetical protein